MSPRGTVLVVGAPRFAEPFRASGLLVQNASCPEDALAVLDDALPDVVVTESVCVGSCWSAPRFIRELRERLDAATSIFVLLESVDEAHREPARLAGADVVVARALAASELLFEVSRALILRRSGRRLPWTVRDVPAAAEVGPAAERRQTWRIFSGQRARSLIRRFGG